METKAQAEAKISFSHLPPEDVRELYKQYSDWGRHHHTLVWIAASFGVGVSLGGLTLFDRLNRRGFFALGLGALAIIFICHRLAEGNRVQWENSWRVLNAIEDHWGVRHYADNPNGPLVQSATNQPKGVTRKARVWLMWACASAWILAIILKLTT